MSDNAHAAGHAEPHHETSLALYYTIYAILMALLVLTVVVAYYHLGAWALPIAMTIAVIKAALVVIYFMHMRYTGKLMWIYTAVGVLWMMFMIVSIIIDASARGVL